MEVFQPSVIQVEPSTFNPDAYHQIHQLSLTTDLSSILHSVQAVNQHVYHIYGQPGSGCSTLIQGICQHVCNQPDTIITESDILYLSLNHLCNKEKFDDFIGKMAKQRNGAVLFNQSSQKEDKRKKIIVEFFDGNFKVICIDNAEMCSGFVDEFLVDALKACKRPCFVVFNHTNQNTTLHDSSDITSIIHVCGLNHSDAKSLASKELQPTKLSENQLSKLCELVQDNPAAIQVICGLVTNSSQADNIISVLQHVSTSSNIHSLYAMNIVIEVINKVLQHANTGMLQSLSCLRRPLPLLQVPSAIKELVDMKLLSAKEYGDIQFVFIHPTLKMFLMNKKHYIRTTDEDINCLKQWLSLVSNKELCKLIKEAEENAWPFVPEPWQFIDDVKEEDSFNIKEHIVAKNANVPSITELEILSECLYHAYMQDEFTKLAAVTFVLDRFLFWNGDSKLSMAVLDYIQCRSPRTPLAPQLFVRRARFTKNEGNLRGAIEVLNMVTKEKDRVGEWKYKAEYQSQLTKAACIQLNGEVQYSLGNWYKSADLLLQSIELFATLPRPDKKGLALGYGLLCPCLRNMTLEDYSKLAFTFGLIDYHPLLASYICAKEAAQSSTFTPMHFVRHICHAGEVLLQFIQLSPVHELKQKLLRVAIEDLKDSIQAHQTYKSLTSREQFYILVLASFKLSIALSALQSGQDQKVGQHLKGIAVKLYEHYCCCGDYVPINDNLMILIDQCLDMLGLEKYHMDNVPNPGQVLQEYYKRRLAQRLENNASLTVQGLFVKSKISLSPAFPEHCTKDGVIVSSLGSSDQQYQVSGESDGSNSVVTFTHQDEPTDGAETVDQFANTKEDEQGQEKALVHTMKKGLTVDRNAVTVDITVENIPAKGTHTMEDKHSGQTVDRNAVTKDLPQIEGNSNKTMDVYAKMMSHTVENDTGAITQILEHEAVSLTSEKLQLAHVSQDSINQTQSSRDGILWKYDFVSQQWRCSRTMVFIGDQLVLKKELEGQQRDVYHVMFINQDEPLQRYVAKKYRKKVTEQQYQNDILSQMTARYYVTMFNDELTKASAGGSIGEIQFLPVVLLRLIDSSGNTIQVFNAEPYMSGEFTKLTNNFDWKNEKRRTDLVLAYSHFTYQASKGTLIIVDIQGWAPHDSKGCTYLTDPQIHSSVFNCYGTGNWKQKGFEKFWTKQHPRCNEMCKILQLKRP